jgi:hypothetical protein
VIPIRVSESREIPHNKKLLLRGVHETKLSCMSAPGSPSSFIAEFVWVCAWYLRSAYSPVFAKKVCKLLETHV